MWHTAVCRALASHFPVHLRLYLCLHLYMSCLQEGPQCHCMELKLRWLPQKSPMPLSFFCFLFFFIAVIDMNDTARDMCVCHSVTQLCPTLCDPMDCSLPGSFVHAVSQARTLEWVTVSSSIGSSWPRDQTPVSCGYGDSLPLGELGKPLY